jgi:hypothetical protein
MWRIYYNPYRMKSPLTTCTSGCWGMWRIYYNPYRITIQSPLTTCTWDTEECGGSIITHIGSPFNRLLQHALGDTEDLFLLGSLHFCNEWRYFTLMINSLDWIVHSKFKFCYTSPAFDWMVLRPLMHFPGFFPHTEWRFSTDTLFWIVKDCDALHNCVGRGLCIACNTLTTPPSLSLSVSLSLSLVFFYGVNVSSKPCRDHVLTAHL